MTDPERDFSEEPTITEPIDPGRAMLAQVVEVGLLTKADADALDMWAGALADEVCEGKLTEAEMHRRILARLEADLARRGSA
jgi:hypothetical protein